MGLLGLITKRLQPEKAPLLPLPAEEFDVEAYRALADKVGFTGVRAALLRAQSTKRSGELRAFLIENSIEVYTELAVYKYMTRITPGGHEWGWVPLNERARQNATRMTDHYTKPIPTPVLLTMERIIDAFADAKFQVTDISRIERPDPFLRVSVDGETWFIIERWDEPAFRG